MIQYYPIKLLKMVTGEQVITGIGEGGENNYILERPMQIMTMPVRKNKNTNQNEMNPNQPPDGIALMLKEWIDFTLDDYIIVQKQSVVCITTPVKELIADYQMAKINADIEPEIKSMPDMLDDSYEEAEDDGEDEEENPEFPGWGGDPRFGS
jgi:hypothetical protein